MSRKRILWFGLSCILLLCCIGAEYRSGSARWSVNAWAAGRSEAMSGGRTDVMAGVVVDYMGRVRFEVLDKNDETPIAGASIELYIPALDEYVLFGMSDENGIFEMALAYNREPGRSEADQFTQTDGKPVLPGSLLYLDSNPIRYQVYKADWLPYPNRGNVRLEAAKQPQVVTVYLYQEEKEEPPTESPTNPTTEAPTETPTSGPETSTAPPATSGGGGDPKPPTTSPSTGKPSTSVRGQQLGGVINQMIEVINDVMVPLGDKYTDGLPKTGVEGAAGFWLAGLLMFVLAGGYGWRLIKNDENDVNKERGE